jgi:cytochrome c
MMDSFELTKIAAGVLTALLVIFGANTIVELNIGGHGGGHSQGHAGYTLPTPEAGAATEKAAAPAAPSFDPAAVATAAASADAAAGESVFKKCASCHTIDSPKGSVGGFSYSDDLKAKGGNWELADLASFLHKPKDYIPKSKMAFGGIKDTGDLANLLAYLAAQK